MSSRQAVPTFAPTAPDDTCATVGYYRTDLELQFYLRAFKNLPHAKWVVVVGLRDGVRVTPADYPPNVRLVLTTATGTFAPGQDIGWTEPDPMRAVVVGMTVTREDECLMLMFPADWAGESPDDLIEKARRWRSGPHRSTDDTYFG